MNQIYSYLQNLISFDISFLLNSYFQAALIIIVFLLGAKIIAYITNVYLIKWTKNTKTKIDDIILSKIKPPFSYIMFFIGIKLALNPLNLENATISKIIDSIVIVAIVYILAVIVEIFIVAWGDRVAKKTKSEIDNAIIIFFSKVIKVVFLLFGALWILKKWNIDITPLMASLGVAGLALGFAVKDSLANIFGGISMTLDKTIKVGNKIKIDSGEVGIIYDIGLRSTKLRTFSNEIIIIPNGKLSNSKIQNFSKPTQSGRVDVNFSVKYGSNTDNVKKVILDLIKSLDDIMDNPKPDVLFLEMGDSALKFSARFWVDDQSKVWTKKLEAVDKIYKELNKAGIVIPFPTQTIYIKKD